MSKIGAVRPSGGPCKIHTMLVNVYGAGDVGCGQSRRPIISFWSWVEKTSVLSTTNELLAKALNCRIQPERVSGDIHGGWSLCSILHGHCCLYKGLLEGKSLKRNHFKEKGFPDCKPTTVGGVVFLSIWIVVLLFACNRSDKSARLPR